MPSGVKASFDEVEIIIKEKYNSEFIIVSEYKKLYSAVLVKHIVCSRTFKSVPGNMINKTIECHHCRHERVALLRSKYNIDSIKKIIETDTNGEYTLLSTEYKNNRTPLRIIHNKCGAISNPTLSKFMNGARCPKCSHKEAMIKRSKNLDDIKRDVVNITDGEYECVSNSYINNKVKLEFLHKECMRTFECTVNHFLSHNSRCPYCQESKGERKIMDHLEDKGIEYISQYTFDDLRGKNRKLKFDFGIIQNDNLFMLIEYDGEYHFRQIYDGHDLKKQQEYDEHKNNYCLRNKIPLVRIHYKDFNNVNEILDSTFINTTIPCQTS